MYVHHTGLFIAAVFPLCLRSVTLFFWFWFVQIPTALLGYQLFDSAISRQMGEFMFVSMMGGFMYSFAKLQVRIFYVFLAHSLP